MVVEPNSITAFIGPSGCGKSTLIRTLNRMHEVIPGAYVKGTLTMNGEDIYSPSVDPVKVRRQVGMVFQNPDNQFVGTTVKDDVAFGLENHGVPREEMKKRVEWATQKVKMEEFLGQEPHHLSGGQKQRVAIAGVIAVQPQIIILDEATSMLDPQGRSEVMETVRELNRQGIVTVISITHDLEEAAKADRIIVMNGGEKFAEGSPEEIFKLDRKLVEIGLDLPFSYQVSMKLREAGIALSKNYLDEESLVNELWTLHSKS